MWTTICIPLELRGSVSFSLASKMLTNELYHLNIKERITSCKNQCGMWSTIKLLFSFDKDFQILPAFHRKQDVNTNSPVKKPACQTFNYRTIYKFNFSIYEWSSYSSTYVNTTRVWTQNTGWTGREQMDSSKPKSAIKVEFHQNKSQNIEAIEQCKTVSQNEKLNYQINLTRNLSNSSLFPRKTNRKKSKSSLTDKVTLPLSHYSHSLPFLTSLKA